MPPIAAILAFQGFGEHPAELAEVRLKPLHKVVDSLNFRTLSLPKLDAVRELVREAVDEVYPPTSE